MSRMIKFLSNVLETGWMEPDDEGLIHDKASISTVKPTVIDNKRMVLPVAAQLRSPNPDTKVVFHPLNEDLIRGESMVIEKLRQKMSIRINWVASQLMKRLVELGASHAQHSKLNPDQSVVLSPLKDVDERSITDLDKVMQKALQKHGVGRMIYDMFLKQRGKIGTTIYGKVGVVQFPMYNELKAHAAPYGVKLRQKDRQAFIELFEYIFSNLDVEQAYNAGSSSTQAPFLEALLKTVAIVIGVLNEKLDLFESVLDNYDQLTIPCAWLQEANNVEVMKDEINLIPPQMGNDGAELREQVLAREQAVKLQDEAADASIPPWDDAPAQSKVHETRTAATSSSSGTKELSYAERVRQATGASPNQPLPVHQPLPVMQTMYPAAPSYAMPVAGSLPMVGGAQTGADSYAARVALAAQRGAIQAPMVTQQTQVPTGLGGGSLL